jgi:stage II sporulation protein M
MIRMNKKLINKFIIDIKNVLTRENLKEKLKLPIYAYILGFFIGLIIVIVINFFKPDAPMGALNPEKFKMDTSMTWWSLIINNIKVLITFFISGIVLYIGPLLTIGINGFVHGLLLWASIQSSGAMGVVKYLILMVPHGIFEVPALLFGAGAGIILSHEIRNLIIWKVMNKSKLYEAFIFLLIAFGLLLIASIIETQLTFRISNFIKF